jgi:peptidoglycan pentaglycine glycine transferase (the first glycine)
MRSFLQTTEWLEFQKEVGHKIWRFDDGKIKANIIKLGLPMGKSMLYIPHGPEIDFEHVRGGLKNELGGFVTYLKDLAKEEGAIFVKMEPISDVVIELLYRKGFKRSSKQIQPYKTVVLNLELSEDELLSQMHQKTRYNIKVAEKNGVTIKNSHDFESFWKLLNKTTKRDRFSSHPRSYYEKLLNHFKSGNVKAELVMSYQEDKPVAGALILIQGETGYYLHGASDYDYRNLMAPYALHWEIVKHLKGIGIKHYDLWGIDANKWPGVTRFKLGWGGVQKEFPGSFDLIVSRPWYWTYSLARKIL